MQLFTRRIGHKIPGLCQSAAVFGLAMLLLAPPAHAQNPAQAFKACMANCRAQSCAGNYDGKSCKNAKLACFASCQNQFKPVKGNKLRRKPRR